MVAFPLRSTPLPAIALLASFGVYPRVIRAETASLITGSSGFPEEENTLSSISKEYALAIFSFNSFMTF